MTIWREALQALWKGSREFSKAETLEERDFHEALIPSPESFHSATSQICTFSYTHFSCPASPDRTLF
jgi:hypothetical protein